MYIKLSDYAKKFGIGYRAAWNRFKAGKIEGAFTDETGHVCIPISHFNIGKPKKAAIYCRVSNNGAKDNLERQVERLSEFTMKNGYRIGKVFSEVASGMNDDRPKLNNLLETLVDYDCIIVENRDRLTRFGYNYIKRFVESHGKELILVNESESAKEDLIKDLTSIVYSFAARMYGSRRAKMKQQQILEIVETD